MSPVVDEPSTNTAIDDGIVALLSAKLVGIRGPLSVAPSDLAVDPAAPSKLPSAPPPSPPSLGAVGPEPPALVAAGPEPPALPAAPSDSADAEAPPDGSRAFPMSAPAVQ